MRRTRAIIALAAVAALAAGGTAAGLALSGSGTGTATVASVSGCAQAIAKGEESGTMTHDSPMPAECRGLSRAQLGEAVGDALTAYLAHKGAG